MRCAGDRACVLPGLEWNGGHCVLHARIEAMIEASLDAWRLMGQRDEDIERFEPSSLEATIGKWPTTIRLLRVLVQNWVDHDEAELHPDFPFRIRDIELELTEERREAHRVANRRWASNRRALMLLIPEAHELEKKRLRDRYRSLSPEQKKEHNRKCYENRKAKRRAV
jgi:hypothetical protein